MATKMMPKEAGGGGVLESHGDTAAIEAKKTPDIISFSTKVSRKSLQPRDPALPPSLIPYNPILNAHWKKEASGLRSTYHSDQ